MSLFAKLKTNIGLNYKTMFWLYLLVPTCAAIPKIVQGKFNNYLIFVNSFDLLKSHNNPYLTHPNLYYDLFRYSPTFAILVAPFTYLPLYVGIIVWNIVNVLTLYFSLKYLFKNEPKKGSLILLAVLPELVTATQNTQINALVTGIMIFSYACFIYKNEVGSAILSVLNLFIKIYGFATIALFFFARKKLKFFRNSILSFIGLIALPILFITIPELNKLYVSQFTSVDSYTVNLSFMGILRAWFSLSFNDRIIQIIALIIVCIPIIPAMFKDDKLKPQLINLIMCSILTFLCAFNQMAESATYVIAVTGAVIWFYTSPNSKLNLTLFILLMAFCEFAPTDIYPRFIRKEFFEPLKIKAIPIVLIWIKIQWDTWVIIFERSKNLTTNNPVNLQDI